MGPTRKSSSPGGTSVGPPRSRHQARPPLLAPDIEQRFDLRSQRQSFIGQRIEETRNSLRLRQRIEREPCEKGCHFPPHTHPYAEVVTVMSGSFGNAMGEKFDPSKGEILKPGSVFALPASAEA